MVTLQPRHSKTLSVLVLNIIVKCLSNSGTPGAPGQKKVFLRIPSEFFPEEITFAYKICVFSLEVREDIFRTDAY